MPATNLQPLRTPVEIIVFQETQTNPLSWDKTKSLVYVRDGGICDVCNLAVEWEYYECGHIIDRCDGGSDLLTNLVCMCVTCNRIFKPVHETKEQYEMWKRGQILPQNKHLDDILDLLKEYPELVVKLENGKI